MGISYNKQDLKEKKMEKGNPLANEPVHPGPATLNLRSFRIII